MSMHLTRRSLLRGGLGAAATGLVLPAAARARRRHPRPSPTDAEIYGAPTTSPLVWQRADPFVTPRTDGLYYFTGVGAGVRPAHRARLADDRGPGQRRGGGGVASSGQREDGRPHLGAGAAPDRRPLVHLLRGRRLRQRLPDPDVRHGVARRRPARRQWLVGAAPDRHAVGQLRARRHDVRARRAALPRLGAERAGDQRQQQPLHRADDLAVHHHRQPGTDRDADQSHGRSRASGSTRGRR